MTRKKLAKSSGCIVEYVGYTVCLAGARDERKRAEEYLGWLFDQLKGPVYVNGWEEREDCTCVDIPQDCVGYVTGARRATLGKIEEEWGTLMFFADYRSKDRGQSVTPACTHAWLRRSGTTPWATKPPPRGPWPRAYCLATSSTRAE